MARFKAKTRVSVRIRARAGIRFWDRASKGWG